MKNRSMQLLIAIAAVLAVGGIGVSFAWFVGGLSSSGSGGSVTQTTSTVGNVTLASSNQTLTNPSYLNLPGGMGVAAQKLVATNADSSNGYTATFNVTGTIANATGTNLTWELYKTTSLTSSPFSTACSQNNTSNGTQVKYFYNGCVINSNITGTSNANRIGNGTTNGTSSSVNVSDNITLGAGKNSTVYYYLVVTYPNTEADQTSAGQGKGITATLTGTTATQLVKN